MLTSSNFKQWVNKNYTIYIDSNIIINPQEQANALISKGNTETC